VQAGKENPRKPQQSLRRILALVKLRDEYTLPIEKGVYFVTRKTKTFSRFCQEVMRRLFLSHVTNGGSLSAAAKGRWQVALDESVTLPSWRPV
jgi:hypothetical protein